MNKNSRLNLNETAIFRVMSYGPKGYSSTFARFESQIM